jgi:hypothetical protein
MTVYYILNSEILSGYYIFRRDRIDRAGGGILVAIKADTKSTRCLDLERKSVELVVVELSRPDSRSFLLYTFYRPPDSLPEVLQHLNLSLQSIQESDCCVVGDFNLPMLDWSNDQAAPVNIGGNASGNVLCELVGDNLFFTSIHRRQDTRSR